MVADTKRDAEWQWAGRVHLPSFDRDRIRGTRGNELPRSSSLTEATFLLREFGLGNADFAIGSATDPDRDPCDFDHAYGIGVTGSNMETGGIRHRGAVPP